MKTVADVRDGDTGLYYYRARYYSPVMARFISEDPIGLAGGINMYAYVGNNPLNFVDPWGLEDTSADYSWPIGREPQVNKTLWELIFEHYENKRKEQGDCRYYCGLAPVMPCLGTGIAVQVMTEIPGTGFVANQLCREVGGEICDELCGRNPGDKEICSDANFAP